MILPRLATLRDEAAHIPAISHRLLRWFSWYAGKYVRRNFHAVRLSKESISLEPSGVPLIIYLNHPSWWDPLICMLLATTKFPRLRHYAPMDAEMLNKYRFFRKLGFFAVDPGDIRGAAAFLRTSRAICNQSDAAIWITAQGEFADVRSRPVRLRPGLSHLLRHVQRAVVVPLAIEYVYWEERFPEVLLHFGQAIDWQPSGLPAEEVSLMLEARLAQAQDSLAQLSQARNAENFDWLLSGYVGVGGIYDVWRRMTSWARGRKFDPRHGRGKP